MRQQCSSACAFSAQVQCPAEMGIAAQAILHPTITFTHYAQRYMQQPGLEQLHAQCKHQSWITNVLECQTKLRHQRVQTTLHAPVKHGTVACSQ